MVGWWEVARLSRGSRFGWEGRGGGGGVRRGPRDGGQKPRLDTSAGVVGGMLCSMSQPLCCDGKLMGMFGNATG